MLQSGETRLQLRFLYLPRGDSSAQHVKAVPPSFRKLVFFSSLFVCSLSYPPTPIVCGLLIFFVFLHVCLCAAIELENLT